MTPMTDAVQTRYARIPKLGFGTWQLTGDDCVEGVRDALELGYRHIDTAAAYENEELVGRGIEASGVDRRDLFLVTKIWHTELGKGEALDAIRESMRKLDTDYLDLVHVHWPSSEGVPLSETMKALVQAQKNGWVHHLGVCNFTPSMLREAAELAPISTIQVEHHPFLAQDELRAVCREHDIALTAYSPLARGRVNSDPVITEIAAAHDATPAQVTLAWLLAKDLTVAIPKAASADHRRENLAAVDLELTDEERARIDDLASGERIIDPDFAPEWEHAA